PDALAVDARPCTGEEVERVGGAVELDPDLLEDALRVRLDERQPLLGEDLDRPQCPREERHMLDMRLEPRGLPRGAPSAPPAPRLAHEGLLSAVERRRRVRPPAPVAVRLGGRATAAPSL